MSGARRRFLGRAAALAAAGWTGVVQRAAAIGPAGGRGDLRDVQHVVVLMQENRSFDHYFGSLNGVRGFADPFPLPLPGARTVWLQPRDPALPATAGAAPHVAPYHLDTQADFRLMRAEGTPHRWPDAQQAWDHGRMADWPAAKREHAMAYFARDALGFQVALADAFTLCDAYHCSFQGGTHPNRYFLMTGTNDPSGRGRGPAIYNDHEDFGPAQGPGSDGGYDWTTYAERLQAAGVDWHVYQDLADNFGDNSLAAFRRFRDAYHRRSRGDEALARRAGSSGALERLREDVLAARLPAVSWIVGTAEGSEHPWKSSPAQGAAYTARVLEALTANPEVWRRTVFFVNYDENDGYFDHVPPPAPPSVRPGPDGAPRHAGRSTIDTAGEYHLRLAPGHEGPAEAALLGRPYGLGPRVPMFVVSPWSRGGWVCSQVFDHTSVIRFIEARFGVPEPNISAWRRAVCGDLTGALDFAVRGRRVLPMPALPDPAAIAARARALPQTTVPPAPSAVERPSQPPGARPARALPYALDALARTSERGVSMRLANRGSAAAVVHVYDRLRLQDLPRRYTLAPGSRVDDDWSAAADGAYDLWLLGPNGWHRRVSGSVADDEPLVELRRSGRRRPRLELVVANRRGSTLRLRLHAPTYVAPAPLDGQVASGGTWRYTLPLDARHHWYDWCLTLPEQATFLRRWAGHVETGGPSITDPAMHGPAVFDDGTARPAAVQPPLG